MKCPNCSNEVPDTANVCGHCGQRLKSAVPPPLPPYEQPPAKIASQPAATSGVWRRFGVLLFGAVLMSFSNAVFHPSSFSAEYTCRGIGLILLAFAAVSYWQGRNRGLGCFIGVVGLGLLMTFILFSSL